MRAGLRTRGALLAVLGAAGGCTVATIEPMPLAGPAPEVIAVWPAVAPAGQPFAAELLAGLGPALRARGYRVVSAAVARELLAERGIEPAGDGAPRDLPRAGMALGADAVLVLDVREFAATVGRCDRAAWELGWRLLSVRGHGELWRHEHRGSWARADTDDRDPLRPIGAEPELVPIGGARVPSFRDVADLATHLHRGAFAHLPHRR